MNQDVILTIAQAVLANTKVLQTLVDTLPHEAKEAVAAHVEAPKAAPVAPVAVAQPVQVAPAPVAPAAPVMPAPPVFTAPVQAAPAPAAAPFTDGKGLIDYVMNAYRAMGPEKGAGIQTVLTTLGYQNINDVKPEHYGQLFAGVEALKS